MITEASYLPYPMKVISIRALSPGVKAFMLEFASKKDGRNFNFRSGQFVIVSVPGFGESVFTITTAPCQLPKIEIAVRSVGNNTRALHRLKAGDNVFLRGSYGNSFDLQKMAGRDVLIIAGGIGLAPLHSLVKLVENDPKTVGSLKIIVGAKTAEDLIFKDSLAKWKELFDVLLTIDQKDKDWTGAIGTVTDLLPEAEPNKDSIAVLCGPPVMFESAIKKLKQYRIPDENIYLVLERRMKCGIGKCQHCTCGDKYVCKDGPTFSWAEVKDNWEVFA